MKRIRAASWTVEALLAGLFCAGAVVTAIVPNWIEAFGLEPDRGDGSAEWGIVVGFGVAAAIVGLLSRRHYLSRQRSLAEGSQP
jgi:hypothetical protein